MKKKSCRMTEDERQKHERAVKLRKMTDEQLCDYIDKIIESAEKEKEKHICPSVSDFIRHLANKAGTGNGIGQSTVNKIRNFAVEEGFMN